MVLLISFGSSSSGIVYVRWVSVAITLDRLDLGGWLRLIKSLTQTLIVNNIEAYDLILATDLSGN